MRDIWLSRGYIALVDDEDYEIASTYKWHARLERHRDGSLRTIYAMSNVRTLTGWTTQHLHRLILGVTDPRVQVDHVDGDGLNCLRSNLRLATNSQNQGNSKKQINNTSGFKGVYWGKRQRKWHAAISMNNKLKHLGMFSDPRDAARAYDVAAIAFFGEFAKINGPTFPVNVHCEDGGR